MRSSWPWTCVVWVLGWALGAALCGCTSLLGDFAVSSDAANADATATGDAGTDADASLSADGSRADALPAGDVGLAAEIGAEDAGAGGGADSTIPTDGGPADAALADGNGDVSSGEGGGPCRGAMTGDTCAAATCSAGMAVGAGACASSGTCQLPTPTACAPYVCGPSACKASCADDSECVPGDSCSAGVCLAKKAQGGSPCARDVECQPGLSCSPEGICCNSPCSGACQVCNSAGTCVPVPANQQPRMGHAGCTSGGSSPCGGYCDGVDIGCYYPTAQCGAASCGCYSGHCQASPAQYCANGVCPNPVITSCNGFACDSTNTACNPTCDPVADTGCYGFNCCHAVFTGACFHSCTATCPASGICM